MHRIHDMSRASTSPPQPQIPNPKSQTHPASQSSSLNLPLPSPSHLHAPPHIPPSLPQTHPSPLSPPVKTPDHEPKREIITVIHAGGREGGGGYPSCGLSWVQRGILRMGRWVGGLRMGRMCRRESVREEVFTAWETGGWDEGRVFWETKLGMGMESTK